MKSILLSMALVGIISLFNITDASAQIKRFTNVTTDSINNTETITISLSDSDKYLEPQERYQIKYDNDGDVTERIIYKWNDWKKDWTPTRKYEYIYNNDKKLEYISYVGWDNRKKTWDKEVFTSLIYYPEKGFLSMGK